MGDLLGMFHTFVIVEWSIKHVNGRHTMSLGCRGVPSMFWMNFLETFEEVSERLRTWCETKCMS